MGAGTTGNHHSSRLLQQILQRAALGKRFPERRVLRDFRVPRRVLIFPENITMESSSHCFTDNVLPGVCPVVGSPAVSVRKKLFPRQSFDGHIFCVV